MQDERLAEMDVDKVSSHPCHRLSIPSAHLFWCRHCMQKFEDPISRWRHSRSCKTDGPVNHSRRKEKEAHAYQLYIESSNLPMPEPTPLPPPVVLTAKPLAMSGTGASSGTSTSGQPSDLSCFICKKEFHSLEEMKAHVRDPCNKTRDTSDFPFEVPEHLKPVEPSPHSAHARRQQRETSRFSTISRRPAVSGPVVVEPIRVYPRTPQALPVAAPRTAAPSMVRKVVPAASVPSKELSLTELLSQLADGGGEMEVEEETLEDRLAKEAEQLLALPQPPTNSVEEEGKENGNVEEEEDIEDIFPFHPSRPKRAVAEDKPQEERLEVPEPAANVEIDQTESLVEEMAPLLEEKCVVDESQESSCGDVNSSSQEGDEVTSQLTVTSGQEAETKEVVEQTKPLLKPANKKSGRKKQKIDTEKENNSKPVEAKRKRSSNENDPVLQVKRTRRATRKAEALLEEKKMKKKGKQEVKKVKKSSKDDNNVKDSNAVSDTSTKVIESNVDSSTPGDKEVDLAVDSDNGAKRSVLGEKDSDTFCEVDPLATPEQTEKNLEDEKMDCLEETASSGKPSPETLSVKNEKESDKSQELQPALDSKDLETKSDTPKEKEGPAPHSNDKKTCRVKTVKPVKCKVCDRTFKSAQLLHKHTRFPCKIKHTRNYTQKMLRPKRALPPKPSPKPAKKKVPRVPKKVYKIWPFELKFDFQLPTAPSNRKSRKRKKRRSPFPDELPPREKTITLPDKELLVSSLDSQQQFLYELGLVQVDHLSADTRANIQIQLANQRPFTHLMPLSVMVDEQTSSPAVEVKQEAVSGLPFIDAVPGSAEPVISPPILEKIDLLAEPESELADVHGTDLSELEPPTLEPAIPAAFPTPSSADSCVPVLLPAATTSPPAVPGLDGSGVAWTAETENASSSPAMDTAPELPNLTQSSQAMDIASELPNLMGAVGSNHVCSSSSAEELQVAREDASEEERSVPTVASGSQLECVPVAEKPALPLSNSESSQELQEDDSRKEPPSLNGPQPMSDCPGEESHQMHQEGTISTGNEGQDELGADATPDETEMRVDSKAHVNESTNLGSVSVGDGKATDESSLPASDLDSESKGEAPSEAFDDKETAGPVSQSETDASVDEICVPIPPTEAVHEERFDGESDSCSSKPEAQGEKQTAGNDYQVDSKVTEASGAEEHTKEPAQMLDGESGSSASVEEPEGSAKTSDDDQRAAEDETYICETLVGNKMEMVSSPLFVKCDGPPTSPELKSPNRSNANRHFLDLFATPGASQESLPPRLSQQSTNGQSQPPASALSVSIPLSPAESSSPSTPSPSKDMRLSPGGSPISSINVKQALKNLGSVLKRDASHKSKGPDSEQTRGSSCASSAQASSNSEHSGSPDQTLATTDSVAQSLGGGHAPETKSGNSFQNVDPSDMGADAHTLCTNSHKDERKVDEAEENSLLTTQHGKLDPVCNGDENPSHFTGGGHVDSDRSKSSAEFKLGSQCPVESSQRKSGSGSEETGCQHYHHESRDASSDGVGRSRSSHRDRSPVSVHAERRAHMGQLQKGERTGRHHSREKLREPKAPHHRQRDPGADGSCGTGKGENHKSASSRQSMQNAGAGKDVVRKSSFDLQKLQKSTDRFYSRPSSHTKKRHSLPVCKMPGKSSAQNSSRESRLDERSPHHKRFRSREENCCGNKLDSEHQCPPSKKMKYSSSASGHERCAEMKDGHHGKTTQRLTCKAKTGSQDGVNNGKKLPVGNGTEDGQLSVNHTEPSTVVHCRQNSSDAKCGVDLLETHKAPEGKASLQEKMLCSGSSGSETLAGKVNVGRSNQSVWEEKRNLFESFQPVPSCSPKEDEQEPFVVVSSEVSVPGVLKLSSDKNRPKAEKKRVSFAEEPVVHDIPACGETSVVLPDKCASPSNPPHELHSKLHSSDGSSMPHPDSERKPEVGSESSDSTSCSSDVTKSHEKAASPSKSEVLTLLSNLSPLKSLFKNMQKNGGDNKSGRKLEMSSPTSVENCKGDPPSLSTEQTGNAGENAGSNNKTAGNPGPDASEVETRTNQCTQPGSSATDDADAKTEGSSTFQVQADQASKDSQESSKLDQLIAIISEATRMAGSPSKDSNTKTDDPSQPKKLDASATDTLETILPSLITALMKNSPQKNFGDICRELHKKCQELKARKRQKSGEPQPMEDSPTKTNPEHELQSSLSGSPDTSSCVNGHLGDVKSGTCEPEAHPSHLESESCDGEVVEEGIVCDMDLMDVDLSQENSYEGTVDLEKDAISHQLQEEGVQVEEPVEEQLVLEVVEEDQAGVATEGVAFVILEEKDIKDCDACDLGLAAQITDDSGASAIAQDCLHAVEPELALAE